MGRRGRRQGLISLMVITAALLASDLAGAADNVRVTGELVSGPCSLKTTDITVNTGQVRASTLYASATHRTTGVPFDIELEHCQPGTFRGVTVTLGSPGEASPEGLLPVPHRGVSVGIETTAGHLLPVGQESAAFPLSGGATTVLHLKSFIQAEPDAVSGKLITPGPVNARTTFHVAYP